MTRCHLHFQDPPQDVLTPSCQQRWSGRCACKVLQRPREDLDAQLALFHELLLCSWLHIRDCHRWYLQQRFIFETCGVCCRICCLHLGSKSRPSKTGSEDIAVAIKSVGLRLGQQNTAHMQDTIRSWENCRRMSCSHLLDIELLHEGSLAAVHLAKFVFVLPQIDG